VVQLAGGQQDGIAKLSRTMRFRSARQYSRLPESFAAATASLSSKADTQAHMMPPCNFFTDIPFFGSWRPGIQKLGIRGRRPHAELLGSRQCHAEWPFQIRLTITRMVMGWPGSGRLARDGRFRC
jgi:hypothetical protein